LIQNSMKTSMDAPSLVTSGLCTHTKELTHE
jgi:hypothetical protein